MPAVRALHTTSSLLPSLAARAGESDVREILHAPAPAPAEHTAAEHVVRALVAAGVDTFFGIPGGPVSPVFDAILSTPGARLIESRQETGAVFAAIGYHRASGDVPAIVVTAGPGATNAVTGVASAHLEGVPMLVLSGDVAWAANGGRLAQDCGPEGIDVESMFASTTRAQIRVGSARAAEGHARAALAAATDPERPGPALLVVPMHVGRGEAPTVRIEHQPVRVVAEPKIEIATEACEWLADAKRPLLVFGAGARPHAARIRRLVDALDVPFVTTPGGKGIVSERHPRCLGHGGLAASMWARAYTAAGVDVGVVLGTDLDDSSVGLTRYVGEGGRLVHVDRNPRVFQRNLPTALAVVADVGSFVDAMYEAVVGGGLRNGCISAVVHDARARSAYDVPAFASDAAVPIAPHRAIADLQRAAGDDAVFVSDIGEHMLFALHYLTAHGPDRFHIQLGLGSMGSGIASAIGVALGHEGRRRVVCICGDGGMQMLGMEALVAVEHRLPVVWAVFNDGRYNMVFHGHRFVYGREAPWASPPIDFEAWARSLGIAAARIDAPGEMTPALLDALTAKGPALLDIRIDRDVRIRGGGRNESLVHMSVGAGR